MTRGNNTISLNAHNYILTTIYMYKQVSKLTHYICGVFIHQLWMDVNDNDYCIYIYIVENICNYLIFILNYFIIIII